MTKQKGLIYLYTGDGKGKTTAALGAVLRSLGYGWKVYMIQFIKTGHIFGEYKIAKQFKNQFVILPIGQGFYKILNDKKPEQLHKKTAQLAWQRAKNEINKAQYDLLVLDELNNAIDYNFLDLKDVIKTLIEKPEKLNIIITGRNAKKELIDIADLVTEMKEIKHPFQKGINAQRGIDY